jgi:FkbM family methyltransferase
MPSVTDQKSIDIIEAADSAEDLRRSLAARYPAFEVDRLRRVAIVGAAGEGARFASFCRDNGIEIAAICDGNETLVGGELGGCRIGSLGDLERQPRDLPVVIASHRVLNAQSHLRDQGFVHVAPLGLIGVLAPKAFPPHMFYEGWLDDTFANRNHYRALDAMLADDLSRRVLDRILAYRLTLDAEVLRPIIEWELYGFGLIKYSDDEVYIDAGAFDGDSIRLFIERVDGRFERIIGFEPDARTYARLRANFTDDPRIETVNKGLHRRAAVLRFENAGTRGSAITGVSATGVEIPVVGLDEVLNGGRVSFLKMNIEGAELEALKGARNAIAEWQPKLAISAYHRPTDLWQVPFLIRELRPDYRMYLRQHDGGVIETVVYGL